MQLFHEACAAVCRSGHIPCQQRRLAGRQQAGQVVPWRQPPQLQATPERELDAFRRAEEEILSRWGWSDRAAGRAQVPVERAIEQVAAEGRLPDFLPPMVLEGP